MDITPELVKKVAINARLNLKDTEIKQYAQEMKDILNNFEILKELDTKDTQPSYHPIPIKNKTRKDEPQESLNRDEALELTPHQKDGYFRGPKTL